MEGPLKVLWFWFFCFFNLEKEKTIFHKKGRLEDSLDKSAQTCAYLISAG